MVHWPGDGARWSPDDGDWHLARDLEISMILFNDVALIIGHFRGYRFGYKSDTRILGSYALLFHLR